MHLHQLLCACAESCIASSRHFEQECHSFDRYQKQSAKVSRQEGEHTWHALRERNDSSQSHLLYIHTHTGTQTSLNRINFTNFNVNKWNGKACIANISKCTLTRKTNWLVLYVITFSAYICNNFRAETTNGLSFLFEFEFTHTLTQKNRKFADSHNTTHTHTWQKLR